MVATMLELEIVVKDVMVVSKQAQVVSFKHYLIHNDGFWRLLFMYFLKDFFGA
jgi:hypothetical protein